MRHLPLFLLFASPLLAQQVATPPAPGAPAEIPVGDTSIFHQLALPPATEFRTAVGAPGPRYWQQRADYSITATLDTASRKLTGSEQIRYTNNSPDTLRFVWMQLDQNLFRPGSVGSLLFPSGSRFGGAGFQGGFDIRTVTQSTAAARTAKPAGRSRAPAASSAPLRTRVDDTMMYVELATPLPPGGSTVLDIAYGFNIPEHGADRMGREGSLYEMAQWYPRMAVYDDVHGWNTDQYLGQGEFYLEYGNFDYAITLPAGFVAAGTGVLQNPGEVLTPTERARLATALHSDTTVAIVTPDELASGAARPRADGMLTWRFHADRVRDVAWAASPEFQWDASGWNGVLTQALYRPSAQATWKDAARMSRFSIQEYSTHWLQYPYPQISAIEGPVTGMEYPMVAMEARSDDAEDLYNVVTHEIGHMWYPMVVGSDERRYAWMDEGFNTFINTFSEEHYWNRSDSTVRRDETRQVTTLDRAYGAQPIMTPANRYRNNNNLGSLAYVKPSIMLLALRNKVLGAEVFDSAFREYTRRWAFRHPQPADFFRTIEEVSGRDLSWFWRGFFYTTSTLDQTIESVKRASDSSAIVVLHNAGSAVMPVELQLSFDDGSTRLVKLPVDIWYFGNRYLLRVPPDKHLVAARVNPDGTFPDVNPSNDAWQLPPSSTH